MPYINKYNIHIYFYTLIIRAKFLEDFLWLKASKYKGFRSYPHKTKNNLLIVEK